METEITAIKFEVVNGTKFGKSFTFSMDPIDMARFKTAATVKRRIEDYVARSGVFKKEELKDLTYDMKEFMTIWKNEVEEIKKKEKVEEERSWLKGLSNCLKRIMNESTLKSQL